MESGNTTLESKTIPEIVEKYRWKKGMIGTPEAIADAHNANLTRACEEVTQLYEVQVADLAVKIVDFERELAIYKEVATTDISHRPFIERIEQLESDLAAEKEKVENLHKCLGQKRVLIQQLRSQPPQGLGW